MSEDDKYKDGPTEWDDFAERLKKYMQHKGDDMKEYEDLMGHFEEEEWTDNLGGLHEDYKEGPGEALCINGLELEEEDELRLNQRIDDVLIGKDKDIQDDDKPPDKEATPPAEPQPTPPPDPVPGPGGPK